VSTSVTRCHGGGSIIYSIVGSTDAPGPDYHGSGSDGNLHAPADMYGTAPDAARVGKLSIMVERSPARARIVDGRLLSLKVHKGIYDCSRVLELDSPHV
jgi:hypothetical protein